MRASAHTLSMSGDTNTTDELGGLSSGIGAVRDEDAALKRVRMISNLLDDALQVPGTDYRIGIDPLLGVIPGAGDSAASLISLYIVLEAANMGAPRELLAQMLANIAIDTVIGSVPAIGVVFDATWKTNKRNVRLLEQHLEEQTARG